MLPRLLGVAVVQLNFLVNTILASGMPEGSLAAITLAFALMIMPQAVLAQSTGIAALPTFSAQVARGEQGAFRTAVADTLRALVFLSLPASLGLILLWQDSAPALWAGAIGLGLFMASIFPTTLMLAGERMRVTGAMTGWFLAGASIGGMSLPWGIGQAFVRIGASAMPVLVLATVAINLLVILLFLVRPVRTLQTA